MELYPILFWIISLGLLVQMPKGLRYWLYHLGAFVVSLFLLNFIFPGKSFITEFLSIYIFSLPFIKIMGIPLLIFSIYSRIVLYRKSNYDVAKEMQITQLAYLSLFGGILGIIVMVIQLLQNSEHSNIPLGLS